MLHTSKAIILFSDDCVFYVFGRRNVWGELWPFCDAAGLIAVFLQGVPNTALI